MKQSILLPLMLPRDRIIDRLAASLRALPIEQGWRVEIHEHKETRSSQQNRYLWGVCYPTIIDQGGEALRGWTAEDLHTYFLGEHFGWETLHGFGKKRVRPLRRSSRLSKREFGDYVDFIQRKAAELGIFIPDAEGA
jgi:hypothetical protein